MTDRSVQQLGQKGAVVAAKATAAETTRQAPEVRLRSHHGAARIREVAGVSFASKIKAAVAAAVAKAGTHRAVGAGAEDIAGSEQLQREVSQHAKASRCADRNQSMSCKCSHVR